MTSGPEIDQLRKDAAALLAAVDEARAPVRERLLALDPARLAQRSPSGEWSVIENVRHLIFAEQLRANMFLPKPSWNPVGQLPDFFESEAMFAAVGTEPSNDLPTVLAAWDDVHGQMAGVVADATPHALTTGPRGAPLAKVLKNLAEHDQVHFQIIDALLGEQSA